MPLIAPQCRRTRLASVGVAAAQFKRQSSATSAGAALPGRSALLDEDGNSHQSGSRIEPWNVECHIRSQASQRDERKIRAGGGLDRIGGQRCIFAAKSLTALEESQNGHRDQRSNGDGDARVTRCRLQPQSQRRNGNCCDHEGKHKEQSSGRSACPPFRDGQPRNPLQNHNSSGKELYQAIGAKGQHRRAVSSYSCIGGDAKFHKHPGQSHALYPKH